MKFNGQDVKELSSGSIDLSEGVDSFEVSDELANKVLSEKGQSVSKDIKYTVDTKRGTLLGISSNDESCLAKAEKTWRGFSELGNFAEVREVYQERAKLGNNIFIGLCIIVIFLVLLSILVLIWLEVNYGS